MPLPTSRLAAAVRSTLLPTGLVAVVVSVDGLLRTHSYALVPTGLLDESAHLSTSALVLLAVAGSTTLRRHPVAGTTALAASVLIDADHIPLYAGLPHIAADGRPYSHSLATVAVLLAAAAAVPRRQALLAGAALGVSLHFVRDIGTGPGLPLCWPVSSTNMRVDYRLYLGVVIALAAIATARAARDRTSTRWGIGVRPEGLTPV